MHLLCLSLLNEFGQAPIRYVRLRKTILACPNTVHVGYLPSELLAKHRGGRLSFANVLREPVTSSEVVFMAVGTPPLETGDADLAHVESVARELASSVSSYKVIVGKSTVPICTSDWVRRGMVLNGAPGELFDVASNPEFLREGTAVTDFLYADRIVAGANTPAASNLLREIYRPLLDGSYYERPDAIPCPTARRRLPHFITTTTQSAELIKYASNAFLAMKISFINAVATICESVGADVDQVRDGIESDTRIGSRFLYPGIGYGGSCFPKDLSAYRAVARECGYDFRLLEEVMRINNDQKDRFLRKVRSALWTLRGKRLGVLGLAFKGGTDDIRDSPDIAVIQSLLDEGCDVQAYDPAAAERAREVLPPIGGMTYAPSAYEAARDADALLVLTEWDEFKSLDLGCIRELLRYPIVIDGRSLFSPERMREHDFIYLSIGRPDVLPVRVEMSVAKAGRRRPDIGMEVQNERHDAIAVLQ